MAKKDNKGKQAIVKKPLPPKKEKYTWLVPSILFLFSVLLYSNTLDHGYVMDDGAMITDNATTKMGYKGMSQFFKESSVYGATKENYGTYRPLTMATYAFELGRAGFAQGKVAEYPVKQQRRFHIFLYGLSCVVIFFALKILLKNYHPLMPAIASFLFAAHPLHAEVGAFIKSRDELLSILFIFSAIYFLFRHIDKGKTQNMIISTVLFLLATFSKESSITFVVIIPLAIHFFRDKKIGEIIKLSLPYLTCVIVYMIARSNVLDKDTGYMPVINNTLVEAKGLAGRLPTIFYILLMDIKLLFVPHPLTWDYGYNQVPLTNWSDPMVLLSLAVYGALGFFAIKGIKRKNIFSFCIIFYLITISISANIFVLISAVMAERFLFVPSVVFCIAVAYLLTKYLAEANSKKLKPALLGVCGIILAAYAYGTYQRNPDWATNYTLFKSGAEVSTESYRSNSAFAWESLKAGEQQKDPTLRREFLLTSKKHFEKATSIYPKQGVDWYNLGVVLNYLGDSTGSEAAYVKSYEVNPRYTSACYNLGVMRYRKKDYVGALKYWKEADALSPGFEGLNFKLGLVYFYLGDMQNSVVYYEKHFALDPNNYDVVNNLAVVYARLGNTQKSNEFNAIRAKLMQQKK